MQKKELELQTIPIPTSSRRTVAHSWQDRDSYTSKMTYKYTKLGRFDLVCDQRISAVCACMIT